MNKLLSALAIASAMFLPSLSQATIVTSSTGLTTYDKLVTFSTPSLAANTVVTNQYAAQGLTFAALNGGAVRANSCGANSGSTVAYATGDYLNTFGPACITNNVNDSFSMMFANDVSAASIGIYNYLPNKVATFLNGTAVESFNLSNGYNGYLKFSNQVFDEIRFTETSFQNGGYLEFDNVAYVNAKVPEPTTVALLGLGLLGFAASRRKSAKSKNA